MSINSIVREYTARIDQLEADNRRLRSALLSLEHRIADLQPGWYIMTDDGDFNGPGRTQREIEESVSDYTEVGGACTVVQVIERHQGATVDLDDYNGVTAGMDYPATLFPGMRGAA